jgi:hypothetical protein
MRRCSAIGILAAAVALVASSPAGASSYYSAGSNAANSAVQSAVQSARDDAWRRARAQQQWDRQMQRMRHPGKSKVRRSRDW